MTTIVLIRDVFAWVGVVAIGWQIVGVWAWLSRHRRQRTRRARMARIHALEHINGLDPYWYADELIPKTVGVYQHYFYCAGCRRAFWRSDADALGGLICGKCVRETLKTTV